MQANQDHVQTTHAGSLPRPDDLRELLERNERGVEPDAASMETACAVAVNDVVARQKACGIDIVSDGEMSKISYVGYVRDRLRGVDNSVPRNLEGSISPVLPTNIPHPDIAEYPDFAEFRRRQSSAVNTNNAPNCTGPLSYNGEAALGADIGRLKAAMNASNAAQAFMTAASPGVLAMSIPNSYYPSEDAFVEALAQAMKQEYEGIYRAGFFLQIDCPDLAASWHTRYWKAGEDAFLSLMARNVEAINAATVGIPAEAMRVHICWGNYAGPHTHDFPVSRLIPLFGRLRAQAISFEGANPRHEHEWEDWRSAKLPDDKILVPGVIDSTTNFVEHPRLVAQRIRRYTDIVGRERVIAGTDCGFGTFALRHHQVFPTIVWPKLKALADGARMVSDELW